MPRRVGGEYVVGIAETLRQQRGQVQCTVEALAVQLPQPFAGFLGMAQKHQGLRAISRLGAAFDSFQRQRYGYSCEH
ncbi:hypothetical protein D3C80_1751390 [compost metagenome]